ncbi:MAG: hypothetical protein SCM57_04710 [Bacillota bacterium]|nr:hypothetical protein [Bacillota bacterium]
MKELRRGHRRVRNEVRMVTAGLVVFVAVLSLLMIVQASSGIQFSNHSPAKGSTISAYNPTVSVYVYDPTYNLVASSLKARVDGNAVPASIEFKGHWETDSCGGLYWVVDSYQEGTVSFKASNLAYGTHTVEVEIANSAGEVAVETWSFTVSGDITFGSHQPANGSVTGIKRPVISVRAFAPQGTFSAEQVEMTVGGQVVTPTVSYPSDYYLISYQGDLTDGSYPVTVDVYNSYKNVYDATSWSFTVDATPKASNWSPVKGSTLQAVPSEISVLVTDTFDNIDGASLTAKINGQAASASFHATVVSDTCGIITYNYKEGTVKISAAGLQDGINTVEYSIADAAGNVLTDSWSFTVQAAPQITNLTPANGSEVNGISEVSAVVTDNAGVDWNSVKLYKNGVVVAHTVDGDIVRYSESFPDGSYQFTLEASDLVGNKSTATWNFVTVTSPPTLSKLVGVTDNMTITNGILTFDATLTHLVDIKDTVTLKLNGEPLDFSFSYMGYTDSCTGVFIITSKKEAYVKYEKPIAVGNYTLELFAEDHLGNQKTWAWSLEVVVPYMRFFNHTPSAGTTVGALRPGISVQAGDGVKDKNNVRLSINGQEKVPVVEELAGDVLNISYLPDYDLDGLQTVTVSVYDLHYGEFKTTQWSFTADALPKASEWVPAKDSSVATASPEISVLVTDTLDNLNGASVTATLDGQPVNAVFTVAVLSDTCGIITYNYKQGTISYNPTGLQDGQHTFATSIADAAGYVLNESWSFTVAEPPKIGSLYPANGSENGGISEISAVVTDNSAVDWSSVKLYKNGEIVAHTHDPVTGKVNYVGDIPHDFYQMKLEVADIAGNLSTMDWSFAVVTSPPTLSELKYFTDGMTITNGNLRFDATLTHPVDMKDNVTLKLNGEPLAVNFRYKGYTDTCTGVYIITSKKEAYVTYDKPVPDGTGHTLELYAEDKFGNNRTWTWTFNNHTPPTISNMAPVQHNVTDLQPVISATVKDNDTLASVVMTVYGETVTDFSHDPVTGLLTYQPAAPLVNEMSYNVTVTATDGIGISTTKTWVFTINIYPDMADSNISNCVVCHENKSTRSHDFEAVHPSYLFSGHDNYCGKCHNYVSNLDVCGDCHNQNSYLWQASTYPPHGLRPDKKYYAQNYSSTVPIRVSSNRENWDCVICHQPGAGTTDRYNVPLNNHDIPQLHKASAGNCVDCHALSLTREHARAGRVDEFGQPITCLTCHASTRSDVQAAISTKNLDCGACHGIESTSAGHSSIHEVSLGVQCVNCHGSNMMSESIYHQNNCKGCHSSTVQKVQNAIEFQNRTCFGCHETPHGVKMSVVREDIPLYSGLTWSKPDPATVWSGEGWLPPELNNDMATVLYSASAQLDSATVNQFYKTQMETMGWTLLSEEPGANGTFNLLYQKGRRHAGIWFYSGMSPLDSGGTGYRIMIVYN